MNKQKIAIASDHAGFDMKKTLKTELDALGYEAEDMGTHDTQSVDYPDFAHALARWVEAEKNRRGVLICGSGIGMSIAANRHKGVRAALAHGGGEAALARRHNDANVLCLGARITSDEAAKDALRMFLNTAFEGGRHEKRVEKLG
ncbi:MAG: ribose 5-phosphate isomerase B [Pseudomonadota bacterium]|nr:ribose 5-phosphate isomerase B [Pseudomonadota bacterium]MDE3037270.1 ribose 5-phosphate isomerase B [Pseudomonadota bacterium]